MRRLIPVRLGLVVLTVCMCEGASSVAMSQDGHWWDAATFNGPKGVKRATVSEDGVTLATITVPDGVLVSVYSEHGLRVPKETLHGRSEIRVRSMTGLTGKFEMESVMSTAPVVLSVASGEVTMEDGSH